MEKNVLKETPVLRIHEFCSENPSLNFKIGPLGSETCSATEFSITHKHDFFEIIWIRKGKGVHEIDLRNHYYEGPSLFILAPGQVHHLQPETDAEGFVVKFLPELFKHENEFFDYVLDTCLFDTDTSCPILKMEDETVVKLNSIFQSLYEEFLNPEPDSENVFRSYLKILITQINRIKRAMDASESLKNKLLYSIYRTFILELEKHYKQEHSVKAYADMLRVPTRQLNEVTRLYADRSAGEVIQSRILLEAKRNLFHQAKNIKEICYDLGLEDPAYFTRFFKKHTGLSPAQFREQILETA